MAASGWDYYNGVVVKDLSYIILSTYLILSLLYLYHNYIVSTINQTIQVIFCDKLVHELNRNKNLSLFPFSVIVKFLRNSNFFNCVIRKENLQVKLDIGLTLGYISKFEYQFNKMCLFWITFNTSE